MIHSYCYTGSENAVLRRAAKAAQKYNKETTREALKLMKEQTGKIKATQMSDDNLQKPTGPNYRIPKNETFYHIPYQEAELIKVA